MKEPREWNPVEIDLWREERDMKRSRESILRPEDYGRDVEGLKFNDSIKEDDDG